MKLQTACYEVQKALNVLILHLDVLGQNSTTMLN